AHSNKQGSFGLGLLSIPRSNLLISLEFYCHLKDFYRNKSTVAKSSTDTLKTSTETSQDSSQSLASPALLLIL
ncbi:hypothetical protein Goklo_008142, partial [Gossypium klotzschianum]|nr:hypothetical protein [Gossypium klotzschianum]